MTIPDSWFALLRIETTFPMGFDEILCMARISLLSPQKISALVHQSWAASVDRSYAIWSVALQFKIRYSTQPNGNQLQPMAVSTWVPGALHLTGSTWGHGAAAAANAAALLSYILTCCPWLPAPDRQHRGSWSPSCGTSRKRHSQQQWESSAAVSIGRCALLCIPWHPAQPSHLSSWLSVSGLELRLGAQRFLDQLSSVC